MPNETVEYKKDSAKVNVCCTLEKSDTIGLQHGALKKKIIDTGRYLDMLPYYSIPQLEQIKQKHNTMFQ